MIKTSAHEGREWAPAKTDEEYMADIVRDSLEAYDAVSEATGVPVHDLIVAITTRTTTEGMSQ